MSPSLAQDLARRLQAEARDARFPSPDAATAALSIVKQAAGTVGDQSLGADGPWWRQTTPVVLCDEFLAPGELRALCGHVLAVREAFKPATLISGESNDIYVDSGFRRAETVFDVGPFASVFEQRVSRYLDFACARLGCPHFTQPSFELQLTAMPSGGFFREHDDNSHTNNRTRRLTFVYYFFLRPLTWSGGALRFSPTGDWLAPVDVPPVENRLVFFDSSLRHEVLPYISNVDGLEGSRFTLNGWVHQDSWP